jgi:hypothetical protein
VRKASAESRVLSLEVVGIRGRRHPLVALVQRNQSPEQVALPSQLRGNRHDREHALLEVTGNVAHEEVLARREVDAARL